MAAYDLVVAAYDLVVAAYDLVVAPDISYAVRQVVRRPRLEHPDPPSHLNTRTHRPDLTRRGPPPTSHAGNHHPHLEHPHRHHASSTGRESFPSNGPTRDAAVHEPDGPKAGPTVDVIGRLAIVDVIGADGRDRYWAGPRAMLMTPGGGDGAGIHHA